MHIIGKYRSLKTVNDEDTVNRLSAIMVERFKGTPPILGAFIANTRLSGTAICFRHDSAPGLVLEYVPDNEADTSVTTLYQEHPIFQSRQSLIDARTEVISAIDKHFMAIPNTATVKDEGRNNKEFFFIELGTAQLIDFYASLKTRTV